ncbi:endonuclease/exonuclease/phosphatase family protein [Caulobacter segnis]
MLEEGRPTILAGDYNIIPTDLDVYRPRPLARRRPVPGRGRDRLSLPGRPGLDRRLADDASGRGHLHLSGTICAGGSTATPACRIDHLLLDPGLAQRLVAAGVDRRVRALARSPRRTTRRSGWS